LILSRFRTQHSRLAAFISPPQPYHHVSGTFGTIFTLPDLAGPTKWTALDWSLLQIEQPAGPSSSQPDGRKRRYHLTGRYSRRIIFNGRPDVRGVRFMLKQMAHAAAITNPVQAFHSHSGTSGTLFHPLNYEQPYSSQARPSRRELYEGKKSARATEGPRFSALTADPLHFIVNHHRKGRRVNFDRFPDAQFQRFAYAVDRVSEWEKRKDNAWDEGLFRGRFINHTFEEHETAAIDGRPFFIQWNSYRSEHWTTARPPDIAVLDTEYLDMSRKLAHVLALSSPAIVFHAHSGTYGSMLEPMNEKTYYRTWRTRRRKDPAATVWPMVRRRRQHVVPAGRPEYVYKTRSLIPFKGPHHLPKWSLDDHAYGGGSTIKGKHGVKLCKSPSGVWEGCFLRGFTDMVRLRRWATTGVSVVRGRQIHARG
jgi:hypothetical protein